MAAQQTGLDARGKGLLAGGGLVGALLASTCCVVPLVLLTLGISGAWIGKLTALAPYQGYFTAGTLALLAAGFWIVYWKPRKACADGTYCVNPKSERVIRIVLWAATALIGVALTVDWWTQLLR